MVLINKQTKFTLRAMLRRRDLAWRDTRELSLLPFEAGREGREGRRAGGVQEVWKSEDRQDGRARTKKRGEREENLRAHTAGMQH